jgi:cytochrome P450
MTETTETEIMSASGCPVSHTDYTIQRPLLETYELLSAERERGPFLWNDSRPRPFWMITDYEHVLEALQMPDVFSNEVINALAPEHTFDLLPQYLDPPEHTAMRRVLNRWFAPAAVRRLEPLVHRRCAELIDELRPQGGCDLALMLAGLDTTRSALGYIFHHLARDPELRHRLTAQPGLWPKAVEEFLRLYPLVYTDGRLVTRDIDFHGMPMRKGNIVWLGLGSANHDPQKFAGPRAFDLGREQLSHHLSFGAGPHRCLGMHLARHELIIAVTEWHKRIPDYELATTEPLYERGQQLSINRLPLRWHNGGGQGSPNG